MSITSHGVTLYTTRYCPYCVRAKELLDKKGVTYTEIAVDNDPQSRREMVDLCGRTSVPQIWIGAQHIGGFDDLYRLEVAGELDLLLEPGSGS